MNTRSVDVAVVGAGLMGSSAAWHLARRGLQVALFEQFDLGHTRGSSHGASRIFRLAYDEVDYVRLGQQALPIWREAEEALGTDLLRTTGALDFGPPENLAPLAHALSEAGCPFDHLTRSETTGRFPAFRLPEGWEALHQPDGGVLAADACRLGFARLAGDCGAEVLTGTPVRELNVRDGGMALETVAGRWEAGQVVLATAGWTDRLLRPLGLTVPLKVTREQVAYFSHAAGSHILPFICHANTVTFDLYGLPNWNRPEVKVAQHGTGPEVDPDTEGPVDHARLEPVSRWVRDHLPALDPEPVSAETCLYASSPDDDFILDRVGAIVLAVGFGGHGFKFGAAVGAMVADLIEGKPIPSGSRFAYDRFQRAGEPVHPGSWREKDV